MVENKVGLFVITALMILTFSGVAGAIRGQVWDENAAGGAFNGTAAWTPRNFAGFFYDLHLNIGAEKLQIMQTDLSSSQRTIDRDRLIYSTAAQPRMLQVVAKVFGGNVTLATAAGLERTGPGEAFEGGKYYIAGFVGWQADRGHIALNGKIDKLSPLLLEHTSATSDKKTLVVGEKWDMGGGWTLTAQKINANGFPKYALLVLSKDGVMRGKKIVAQGKIYTYVERSIAGESDVPLFVTYVDNIFKGATTDMVQLRYTWLVSTGVNILKAGDKLGAFKIDTVDSMNKKIILKNTISITLNQGATIDLMGELKFKVADNSTLRFYPAIPGLTPGVYI